MRMSVRAAVAPAPPRARLLLRDTDQHHPEASLALGALKVLASDVLLAVLLGEAHHRQLVVQRELIDRLAVRAADLAQQHRRRDPEPAVQQKPDQHPRRLQLRHVALHEQPVDRSHSQRDVIGQ
jgi:hypothetical protein